MCVCIEQGRDWVIQREGIGLLSKGRNLDVE